MGTANPWCTGARIRFNTALAPLHERLIMAQIVLAVLTVAILYTVQVAATHQLHLLPHIEPALSLACPPAQQCGSVCCPVLRQCHKNSGPCTCCATNQSCCFGPNLNEGGCVKSGETCCMGVVCTADQTCSSYNTGTSFKSSCCDKATEIGCGGECCSNKDSCCSRIDLFGNREFFCCPGTRGGRCCGDICCAEGSTCCSAHHRLCCADGESCGNASITTDGVPGSTVSVCCPRGYVPAPSSSGNAVVNDDDSVHPQATCVPSDTTVFLGVAAISLYVYVAASFAACVLGCCGIACPGRGPRHFGVSGSRGNATEITRLITGTNVSAATTSTRHTVSSTHVHELQGVTLPRDELRALLWRILNAHHLPVAIGCSVVAVGFGVGAVVWDTEFGGDQTAATANLVAVIVLYCVRLAQLYASLSLLPACCGVRASRWHLLATVVQFVLAGLGVWGATTSDEYGWIGFIYFGASVVCIPLSVSGLEVEVNGNRGPSGEQLATLKGTASIGFGFGSQGGSCAKAWDVDVQLHLCGDTVTSVEVQGSTRMQSTSQR